MVAGIGKLRRADDLIFKPNMDANMDRIADVAISTMISMRRCGQAIRNGQLPYPLQPLTPNRHRTDRLGCAGYAEPLPLRDWLPER
jgi:hypothetical protein